MDNTNVNTNVNANDNKVQILSLGLPQQIENITLTIGDAEIAVKPLIGYEEVLSMIQWTVNLIIDDRPFISAPLAEIIRDFSILKYYTNIDVSFLDAPLTDMSVLYESYDLLKSREAFSIVEAAIDKNQLDFYYRTLRETCKSIVDYKNSTMGIIDLLSSKAATTNEAFQKAMDTMKDPEQMDNVKRLMEIAEKLGTPQQNNDSNVSNEELSEEAKEIMEKIAEKPSNVIEMPTPQPNDAEPTEPIE